MSCACVNCPLCGGELSPVNERDRFGNRGPDRYCSGAPVAPMTAERRRALRLARRAYHRLRRQSRPVLDVLTLRSLELVPFDRFRDWPPEVGDALTPAEIAYLREEPKARRRRLKEEASEYLPALRRLLADELAELLARERGQR